jgi:hypothetical protein
MNMKTTILATVLLVSLSAAATYLPIPARVSATVSSATLSSCASVSCEGFLVVDENEIFTPCVNHGCAAGCSTGASSSTKEGGPWSTCKCGGQVEPRCCHLLFVVDQSQGTFSVQSDGSCKEGPNANSACPEGNTCGFWREASEDESFQEFGAICLTIQ